AVFLFGGLGLSGYMSSGVAAGLLVGYLLLAINSYLAAHTLGVFSISWWKFSPTEMRILLAVGNTVAFFRPETAILGPSYRFFDVAGVVAIVCMAAVIVISAAGNARELYRQEPLS